MLTIDSGARLQTDDLAGAGRGEPRKPFEETLLALFGYTRAFVRDRHRNVRRGLFAIF